MTELAWYTGVFVNSTIVIVLFLFTFIYFFRHYQAYHPKYLIINVVLSILGLIVSSLATLLLYLHQGSIQLDLTNTDTILPLFLWIGYCISLVSFLGVILDQSQLRLDLRIGLQGIVTVAYFLLGLGMMSYSSFWNDGAILVVFENSTVEMVGTYISMFVAIAGFSHSLFQRLSFVESSSPEVKQELDRSTSCLLLASLFYSVQFAVPRATLESVTNPVSVKIIGLIIIIGYAYYLIEYVKATPLTGISIPEPSDEQTEDSIIRNRDLQTIVFSLLIVALYVILTGIGFPILSVQEKIELGLPLFQIGELRGNLLFVDPYGCLLPLTIALLIIVMTLLKYRSWKIPDSSILFLVVCSSVLSLVLSIAIHFSSSQILLDNQPRFSVFPYIVSSLVSLLLAIKFVKRGTVLTWKENELADSRIEYFAPLLVFSGNAISALTFDILIADSPFGIIQIGGAGLLDGLLWAPLLSAAFLAVFIIMYRLLWISHKEIRNASLS